MTTALRETLISSGEDLGARWLLGDNDNYSAAEYCAAVTAARGAKIGEIYASKVLGPDSDALLHGVEDGDDGVVRAAEASLRRRGVDPAKATYDEYRAALVEVSE